VRGALLRYRVLANVVGVMLLVVFFVAVPMNHYGTPRQGEIARTISQVHGFLFILYLAMTFDLSRRRAWTLVRTVLVMLAGTVPFVSFVVERRVTRDVLAGLEPAPA
jgi:integral membrane protein